MILNFLIQDFFKKVVIDKDYGPLKKTFIQFKELIIQRNTTKNFI